METVKTEPTLMTVICNIQEMRTRIRPSYLRHSDFIRLQGMTAEELRKEQNELIPVYNQIISN
jgi:hypothetical protein